LVHAVQQSNVCIPVGNWAFADYFKAPEGPYHLHICNVPDAVPKASCSSKSSSATLCFAIHLMTMMKESHDQLLAKSFLMTHVQEPNSLQRKLKGTVFMVWL
jgi:hypothetical protein